ncbi:MAG: DNA replication/repair protein RecF [Verrucomicrobiota bacterium]|nr:DNA replication/repair protein RecF [Verrucomicrobiota bacterium]
MHLSQLRLRDFRNYARLDARFTPGLHLFLGNNAQGKTNILEAIYLLATLRSFRGAGGAQMIRHGEAGYFVAGHVLAQSEHEIKLFWSKNKRKLSLNERPVRKLSEFFGIFRGVVFCSEDINLIKGPSAARRRFLDFVLSQTVSGYLSLLQRYTHALRSRNSLLKQRTIDHATLESYTAELVAAGTSIIKERRKMLPGFVPLVSRAYQRISGDAELFELSYAPSIKADFAQTLAQSKAREQALRTTLVGPHRDDLQMNLNGKPASHFSSEGQKRSIAIALKMAQAEYFAFVHGTPPTLLIDDVMGELDVRRRAAFLPLLRGVHSSHGQAFMTCTEENWPAELSRQVHRWHVKNGTLSPG